MDVSPDCDCWDLNDYPLVPDIGLAASFDPVDIDKACTDIVNSAPALAGSSIRESDNNKDLRGEDKFRISHPDTYWQAGIEHAVKIGLGSLDYELIDLK